MTLTARQAKTQRRIDHALNEARRHAIKEDLPLVWALIAVAEEIRALRLTVVHEMRRSEWVEEADDADA